MEDPDPLLRWSALRVLQSFGRKPEFGRLEKLLAVNDPGVRGPTPSFPWNCSRRNT
jgi:hypothetical protein